MRWYAKVFAMIPKELRRQKAVEKRLLQFPDFKTHKRNKYPRPFHRLGGARVHSTGFVDVSDGHAAFMLWRDGKELTDRLFLANLFLKISGGNYYPLFEFHWHPSHKGIHCKLPCKTDSDYSNRQLPGAPEFDITKNYPRTLDPREPFDRIELIKLFCEKCGITLPESNDSQMRLIA